MANLSELCNNPLNIRFNPANKWQGQTGNLKGFCTFRNQAYGFRAAYKIICNYIKNGYSTVRYIVSRWAPPTENNTENYIRFVENETLIPDDLELRNESIHDYWTIIIILRAMAKMECGKDYDEQMINLFINYPERF